VKSMVLRLPDTVFAVCMQLTRWKFLRHRKMYWNMLQRSGVRRPPVERLYWSISRAG